MKGICFKEPLFLKVVDGTKTQTRRIIFPKTDYTYWSQPSFEGMEKDPSDVIRLDKEGYPREDKWGNEKLFKLKGTWGLFEGDQFEMDCSYVRPKYQPGEIVFLKEPYFVWEPEHCESMSKRFCYRYGLDHDTEIFRKFELEQGYEHYYWHNKLFMPEKYARYFIQITDVTAQKLQEITKADAIAEGFPGISPFQSTWISLHGFSSWPDNPWVWKYTLKLVTKP